jgi:hypothetical protein
VIEKFIKHLGLWDLKITVPLMMNACSVKIPVDDSDSHVPFSDRLFLCAPDISRGLHQDLEALLGDSGDYDFCYLSFVFGLLKTFQFDSHILNPHT